MRTSGRRAVGVAAQAAKEADPTARHSGTAGSPVPDAAEVGTSASLLRAGSHRARPGRSREPTQRGRAAGALGRAELEIPRLRRVCMCAQGECRIRTSIVRVRGPLAEEACSHSRTERRRGEFRDGEQRAVHGRTACRGLRLRGLLL